MTRKRIVDDLFGEDGAFGSLTKLSSLAFHLALISDQERHDLGKIGRLRNRYAHDKHRSQLDTDAEMYKLVTDTFLFKSTPSLKAMKAQAVVLSILDELKFRIAEAASAFKP